MTHQDTEPAATRDSKKSAAGVPAWSLIALAACWLLLVGVLFGAPGPVYASVLGIALIAGVLSAVHHAEVVAHRVGEPFGTLVLRRLSLHGNRPLSCASNSAASVQIRRFRRRRIAIHARSSVFPG